MREAPPAAPRHWYLFRVANFTDQLPSTSFVLLPLNDLRSDRRASPSSGNGVSHHELIVKISMYDISFHVVDVSGVLLIIAQGYRWFQGVKLLVLVLVA